MNLNNSIAHTQYPSQGICLPCLKDYMVVTPYDIGYFESQDTSSIMFLANSMEKHFINLRIHQIEAFFSGFEFCRIHRSFFVCLKHIKKIDFNKEGITLANGSWLPVGRTYRNIFLANFRFPK